jgi:GTPase SAR1 family protein
MKVLNLKPTKGISRENFIFRGLAELNVWDAGGQERYIERYFSENQRELIFSEITTPIFMVDSTVNEERTKEIFNKFISYVLEFSPHIDRIYVLLNKIDLENSKEDEVYELLSEDLDEDLKQKVYFTPVSVKEGSAQHRLIEILDYEIQRSTLSLQKLGKIRHLLDELKIDTLSEYLLFNKPDGLLISSTFGKFESKPLEFMKFEIGTLDSNIYQIYKKIMDLLKTENVSPLELSIVVYQSEHCYVIVKDITNTAVLMAVTKNKTPKVFVDVIDALNGDKFKSLMKFLRKSEI